jgi:hypothetical protein
MAWRLDEEGLELTLCCRRAYNDPALGLHRVGATLVKSETVSSIFQASP